MVFLSQICFIKPRPPQPGPHRFWKRRRILSIAGHLYGRYRKCYRLAVTEVPRTFFHAQNRDKWTGAMLRRLWDTRLNAACHELGTNFLTMRRTLNEVGIGLDRKSLQHLAIWEPRTFRGLAMLTKAKTDVQGVNSLEPPPKGVITRGML